ncbi:hypothetical protein [Ottowia oryzae]
MSMVELEARGSVAGRWQENCEARMNWAFEAYGRLLESLSPEVKTRMASAHPEAYVVVFGRTQVGKTTLLLELMGVDGQSAARVSTVLRGGRGQGKSATATAMEYGRSVDKSWLLQMPNQPAKQYENDAGVCAALGALRHQMESRQLHLEGPVRLDIPCDCFVPLEEGHARVRMLDLPGDQASNPVEQRHVENVAERYIAGADLILLVGKMDDLSFLKPGGLLLPGIEDWQIVPERFRIVTTYSFTAWSMQDAVSKGLKVEHFRIRLLEQLETFGRLSSDARRTDLLFPLEFGQSLEGTARHAPKLVAQIEPLVKELKAELAHQINTATTPMARLRTALRSHLTVAKVKEQKLLEMNAEHEGVMNDLTSARTDLAEAERAHVVNTRRHSLLTDRQEQLVRADPVSRVSAICSLDESNQTDKLDSEKSVKALQARLDKFRTWLRHSFLALSAKKAGSSSDLEWFWSGVRPSLQDDLPAVRRLLDEHLSSIESDLHDYWTDSYWLDSNFERDVKAVRTAMHDATTACRALASKLWLSAMERQLLPHRQALHDAAREVSLSEQLIRQLKAKTVAADDAVVKSQVQRDAFETRLAADHERCHTFIGMLDDSYKQQLTSIVDRLRGSTDPCFALVDLISGVHLIETRSKLLATGSPATSHPH